MLEHILKTANLSINPTLFLIGLGTIYVTGILLLIAVGLKFWEHAKHRQKLDKGTDHFFSTREMTIGVLLLFPFWVNSIGQFKIHDTITQYIFFGVGAVMVLFAIIWHIWAKINIGFMWSDGIEIKKKHSLITHGAFGIARHPMYASLLMWCWGGSFMMFNWVTLLFVSFVFLPLMVRRAKDEEKNLLQKNKDYQLYQRNVRMLVPTTSSASSVIIRIILLALLVYFVLTDTITIPVLFLLVGLHLYFGYSFLPEKVAFSYRSKSGMIGVIGLLSIYVWHPIIYFYYVIMAMCLYGLKWNCPCMLVYEKYHMCPCFVLLKKCIRKK